MNKLTCLPRGRSGEACSECIQVWADMGLQEMPVTYFDIDCDSNESGDLCLSSDSVPLSHLSGNKKPKASRS